MWNCERCCRHLFVWLWWNRKRISQEINWRKINQNRKLIYQCYNKRWRKLIRFFHKFWKLKLIFFYRFVKFIKIRIRCLKVGNVNMVTFNKIWSSSSISLELNFQFCQWGCFNRSKLWFNFINYWLIRNWIMDSS